jgi:cysteine desulfurase/selenocysteine lyase
MDTERIKDFFPALRRRRVVSNNAASTQIPVQLLDLQKELATGYDNVHRGQSTASKEMTREFEASYATIAQFISAKSWRDIILFRNTTEAINAVMYALMTEFRDGDNVVTTYMEHNSNYVPWYGLCREILPSFGIRVQCRIAKFDKRTGELDIEHLRSLVDERTKLVCCTGASNFLGTKNPIAEIKQIADNSGYRQPDGKKRSYLLVDGAQLVPNSFMDVKGLGIDFLAWSFHKMLAPFGVGALYCKGNLLSRMKPFHYGGDMIAEGKVAPDIVEYNSLPWKFTAGTPNILGTILSAQAIRLLMDFALNPGSCRYFRTARKLKTADVRTAMEIVESHETALTGKALKMLSKIEGIRIFGPKNPERRTSLVAFTHRSKSPFDIAEALNTLGVESRASCHCATLAHHFYGLNPPASCRLSFYIYNDMEDVERACDAVAKCVR